MLSLILKIFGPILGPMIVVLVSDPAGFDRWLWLKRNLKKGPFRLLDAGCGTGSFSMYAAKSNQEVIGISFQEEKNKKAEERAKILKIKNVKFLNRDLRNLDKFFRELGLFDQIICLETIEHIIDHKKLLRDFYRLLKPGGRLLLCAPYKYYRFERNSETRLSEFEDGGHVRHGYIFEEMGDLLREAGLEIERGDYMTGWVSQMLCLITGRIDRIYITLGWVLVFPLRIFQIFDKPVTSLLNYPHLSVGMIACKKAN